MFTFSTKRQREHEEPVVETHGRKRARPLTIQPPGLCQKPFLPDSRHVTPKLDPPTLTPVESSDDDDDSKHVRHHLQSTGESQDTDLLDAGHSPMDIDSNRDTPFLNEGSNMHPWSTRAQDDNNIQPSPIPHNLVNQSLTLTDRHPLSPFSSQVASPAGEHGATHQRISQAPGVMMPAIHPCNLRLPSPVSEGEDPQTSLGGASATVNMTDHLLDHKLESGGLPSNKTMSQAATAKPGKKKKAPLAMGFRADCDKCRQKVPGHYSHIIPA
ncbi:hypothetical protein ABOM_010980 [Aspergillus terreus]|uniref:Uncharacterized protein n=1 Tax=Aspergillus terreus TaxID=33178 RepID=A0A5M3Z2W8_ASPTE|nr:hypothetical protein ATETN484_0008032500 [Aspergillus terreus]GFF13616.1 hypothetical protein ABOM_010980 [Aspergillus terreus]